MLAYGFFPGARLKSARSAKKILAFEGKSKVFKGKSKVFKGKSKVFEKTFRAARGHGDLGSDEFRV